VLKRGWAVVIGAALVFGLAALAFSLLQKPTYEAITTLYVTAPDTAAATADDKLVASRQQVGTYAQLAYSGAVLTPALKAAGLDWSLEEARTSVEVESRPEVRTLTIYVRARNPQDALHLAGAIADAMPRAVSTLEAPADEAKRPAKLSVVTPATLASKPVAPTTELNVVLATVIGLFMGALLVLGREALNKKVRDAGDVEAALGARSLTISTSDTQSNEAASFRDLRSLLMLEVNDQAQPRVLVTSARAAEGTATLSVNLGMVLTRSEKSVVIVDANIDHPQASQGLGAANVLGLTDVIGGSIPVSDAVRSAVGVSKALAVLGAGTSGTSYPEGVFASPALLKVLDELGQQFDCIIIDAPPLLANVGTESLLISVNAVVVVTRPDESTIADLVESRQRLAKVETRVVGVVLSDRQTKGSRHRKAEVNA
jgi:receptor protein-tyrosine kinase